VTYDLLRKMTPREYDTISQALREYREEEQRATETAMAQNGGKHTVGGGSVRND
jgi:hypothetical protein